LLHELYQKMNFGRFWCYCNACCCELMSKPKMSNETMSNKLLKMSNSFDPY
jgi:hypothetical protein